MALRIAEAITRRVSQSARAAATARAVTVSTPPASGYSQSQEFTAGQISLKFMRCP